jgi:hypothetical protein
MFDDNTSTIMLIAPYKFYIINIINYDDDDDDDDDDD